MSSKIIEVAFFCNIIIFYCFLEFLETPTVFFLKIFILGQCYTFVHQNCATDHNIILYNKSKEVNSTGPLVMGYDSLP